MSSYACEQRRSLRYDRVLCSILATWGLLQATHMWLLSIIGGFVAWFVSALIIFEIVNS